VFVVSRIEAASEAGGVVERICANNGTKPCQVSFLCGDLAMVKNKRRKEDR